VDGQCVQNSLPGVDPPGRVRSVRLPFGSDEEQDYFTYVTGEQTQPFVDRFATVDTELGYI
jgi:hypothetical protein